jgi:hypothetical protein
MWSSLGRKISKLIFSPRILPIGPAATASEPLSDERGFWGIKVTPRNGTRAWLDVTPLYIGRETRAKVASLALDQDESRIFIIFIRIPAEPICCDEAQAIGNPDQHDKRARDEKCSVGSRCDPADGFDFGKFHKSPSSFLILSSS